MTGFAQLRTLDRVLGSKSGAIYSAVTETLIPWVEDRFGTTASWVVAVMLITLPFAGICVIAMWRLRV
jgi:hypothetical protein